MLSYVLFPLGFLFLLKGADFLVEGASSLARKLKMPELVIGLTIVAFGTSTPELIVNIFAQLKGTSSIAIGNILGSNIANILLILGISSIICPLVITKDTVWKEIPLTLLAAILLGILANDKLIDKENFSSLTKIDGIVLLLFFLIFIYYAFEAVKRGKRQNEKRELPAKGMGVIKTFLFIVLGIVGLNLGGKWVVEGAVKIAQVLGKSQSLVGLTIVALGTSLPELFTSVVAAFKKNTDIAVGNVVGSNIFNIFFILGVSAVIAPLPFETSNNLDIGVTILASLLLFICMLTGSKKHFLQRWEGVLFVIIYVSYVIFLIKRG
ncbi:calcium/sodium antiporter [Candidatus Aerophobetes bacterium]|nr:calcium/sodium antiporter [Candidatus Aerophobetes bacterium]